MKCLPVALSTIFVVGLSACADAGRLAAPTSTSIFSPSSPSFEILDGAHNNGVAGFYFLPPLVAQPNGTGAFDPTRSVVVMVCALGNPAAASCTGGIPVSPVDVDVNGNHYQVNWQTEPAVFPPGNYYRIRIIDQATDAEWGHADIYLGTTGKEFRGIDATEFVPLLDGRTVPIKFRIDQGAVPPTGGDNGGGGCPGCVPI